MAPFREISLVTGRLYAALPLGESLGHTLLVRRGFFFCIGWMRVELGCWTAAAVKEPYIMGNLKATAIHVHDGIELERDCDAISVPFPHSRSQAHCPLSIPVRSK